MLPNSLTEILPFPLVFSTRLPVSVCGTVTQLWLEAFLGSLGSVASTLAGSPSPLSSTGLLTPVSAPTGLAPAQPIAGQPTFPRHPFARNEITRYWNINQLSIGYAIRPRLRTD
jgi:hypothetical protein